MVAVAILVLGAVASQALAVVPDNDPNLRAEGQVFNSTVTFSQPDAMAGADSCDDFTWRDGTYKKHWYNYAGRTSTNVPILAFRYHEGGGVDDTLLQFYVHSYCEKTNTISQLRLYREYDAANDNDTSCFFSSGDSLLATVNVVGPFQTNDSILFSGLQQIIAAGTNAHFYLVANMNSAGINNTTYDETGVMVGIRAERLQAKLGHDLPPEWGPLANVLPPCGLTSPANNGYSIIIDYSPPPCDTLYLSNIADGPCDNACDGGQTILSLGDSLLIHLDLDLTDINPATDSCAVGWPKIFVREFTTNSAAQTMGRYKGSFWNTTNSPDNANWAHFAYVAEFDSTNGVGPFDLMNIPTSPAVNNPIDVNAGFYWLVAELKDVQGNVGRCSTLVNYKIDTKKPATSGRPADWTLYYDANGNGIVNPGDTVRLSVDMSNEPFGEICQATTILYGWGALGVDVPLTLLDQAGDRKFEVKYKVVEGVLDTTASSQMAWIHVFDDACNNDSIEVTLPNAVDNQPLDVLSWTIQFLRLSDTDQNGCLKIGETVRIDITNANDPDLDSVFANLLMAGLGDLGGVTYDRHTLNNLGGGHWQLDWILGDVPQDSAIDYAAGNPAAVVYLYVKDDAGNTDTVATGYLEEGNGGYNIDTEYPDPVENLSCESQAHAVIMLSWENPASDIDRYQIYWDAGTGTINYGAPLAEIVAGPTSWTTDGTVVLTDGQVYKFDVWSIDDCGNVEQDHPTPVACEADGTPPVMCIFQPEAGGLYCDGFFIYVCPQDEASDDVVQIAVQARLKDNGAGNPGPWVNIGGSSQSNEETCFSVELDASALDALVGPDTAKVIQLAILTWDNAGNMNTETVAMANCGAWEFTWSTHEITGEILTINGDSPLYQDYCDLVGWTVAGPTNTVHACAEGGIAPYTIRIWADDDSSIEPWNDHLYYFVDTTACIDFNLNATNWDKGQARLRVQWTDACGAQTEEEVELCVPDTVAPCAEMINPVDGKCIRRSRSDRDPIEGICIEIDPLANCIDPDAVLKVDFQWSTACCPEGQILGWDFFLRESTYTEGGSAADSCDTTYFNELDGDPMALWGIIKRIHCFFSEEGEEITVFIPDSTQILCEDSTLWNTFSIVPGPQGDNETDLNASAQETGDIYCADPWDNSQDLAWITESGTNIWLRAVIYDDQGNKFITECVQVCIDIDTPPLCMDVESPCGYTSDGIAKYPADGQIAVQAVLDLSLGNVDDIEDVDLWYKLHNEPDREEFWHKVKFGFITQPFGGGSGQTVWRWNFHPEDWLEPNRAYDMRVIATTVWGTVSYDMDGNGDFDADTFDSSACDMQVWWIDGDAPNVGIDTIWTEVDGNTIVQPNVSCRLSDPRGWAYAQYGQSITVQPAIWALGEAPEVARIEYRLWDGECSSCDCEYVDQDIFQTGQFGRDGCDSKVLAVLEGAAALNPVTLDLYRAPFVQPQNGFQTHVLEVTVWDECGNSTSDCVTLYLLDITPTDAIIVEPMNHDVFCQDEDVDGGGIVVKAYTLLAENLKQCNFYYRAQGETAWSVIDSIYFDHPYDGRNDQIKVVWYPHALGLPDGTYELKAVATDRSLNVQTTEYITTVHLSCALPTVTMVYPQSSETEFLGNCEIEVTAQAIPGDEVNDITEVCWHWSQWDKGEDKNLGTCDYNSTGTMYSTPFTPSSKFNHSSHYFIWATATNKAGVTVSSDTVLVKYDAEPPYGRVIEVAGDGSDGGSNDPTIVTSGDDVDIYAIARDVNAESGYGPEDNCGVDSVIIYVYDDEGTTLFGKTASVDNNIDSLYMATWSTAGWPNGTYRVRASVYDCACWSATSNYWYVKVINPMDVGTIAFDGTVEVCDTLSLCSEDAHITLDVPDNVDASSVKIYWQPITSSDVYDQWHTFSANGSALQDNDGDGLWEPASDFDISGWSEGVYRVRAVVASPQLQTTEDYNNDGKFDDFTFDPTKGHMMLVKVDCSVTPFDVAVDKYTIAKGNQVKVTVTPDAECDVDEVCYGVQAENGNAGIDSCLSDLEYSFNPIDSGLVTMRHGIWHGPVVVEVSDPLGNSDSWTDDNDLYILDITANQAMVTYPTWGDYVSGDTVVVTARKLTSGTVSNLQFFYGGATGSGTQISGTATQNGDEFTINWGLENVSAGTQYLWTSAATDKRVPVVVVKVDAAFTLLTPSPSYTRSVFNETLTFVGGRVDVCVDQSTVANRDLVDSVVFAYRVGDAPGVPFDPDPDLGWVRFGSDRYGSMCMDWFTNQAFNVSGCPDGLYSLAAWVYWENGLSNHSNIVNVMVDNTAPYSEIVDIDGDETFGDCHQIVLGENDTQVKFTANAVDDKSCEGDEAQFNSGAKYLQFFVGDCDRGSFEGAVDVLFVIDRSGSMVNDLAQIKSYAASFPGLLDPGVDYRFGVMQFSSSSCGTIGTAGSPISTGGSAYTGAPGNGQWTTSPATFGSMVSSISSVTDGVEKGLEAVTNGLNWYSFRSDAEKVVILITDEDSDDGDCYPPASTRFDALRTQILASGARVYTVINGDMKTGYEGLAQATGGLEYDVLKVDDASSTFNWATVAASISANVNANLVLGGQSTGVVWGQQVTLTDGQADAFAYWDPTGLPTGEYCAWTVVIDQIGNRYVSGTRHVCIEDVQAPTAYIAGFGRSTDEHMNHEYRIYGQSWDSDIDRVQFQYRAASSSSQTDWTGIGLAEQSDHKGYTWETQWNPCLLSGLYDLRVVATDQSGNEDFDNAPVVRVMISNCTVTPAEGWIAKSEVSFEDARYQDLGLVNVDDTEDGLDNYHHSLLAVWADFEKGKIDGDNIDLYTDIGDPTHYLGSFKDWTVFEGGTGTFWVAYNDFANKKTYLNQSTMTVYHVNNLGFPGTVSDAKTGAKVVLEPYALERDNGVVIFPARFPILSLMQQNIQVWPNDAGKATAIRLTKPLCEYDQGWNDYNPGAKVTTSTDGGWDGNWCTFSQGTYATVTITYDASAVTAAGLTSRDLTVAWWDGDEWNITQGMIAGGEIGNGTATFYTNNLHGIYAVVSSGRECNAGAVNVSVDNFNPTANGYVAQFPVIYSTVKSNITSGQENYDIRHDMITVTLDGTVIYTDDEDANGWHTEWDDVSGRLITRFMPQRVYVSEGDYYCWQYYYDGEYFCLDDTEVLPLTPGEHTYSVQAFNKTGYCGSDETTFMVDASEPNVYVETGYVCTDPCFWFTVTDQGAGVNWDSVFVDVYDITGSEFSVVPKDKLIHTETPDAFDDDQIGDTVRFCLTDHIADGRRLRIVIYNGKRTLYTSSECGCQYWDYDHEFDGIPDLVGNHTEVVEEDYTVSGQACTDPGLLDTPVEVAGSSSNPFDPWAGEAIEFTLNGFALGGGTVKATVYDLTGEKVKTLAAGLGGSMKWNGSTDAGDIVAEGVYLVHFQRSGGTAAGSNSQALKVVVKRAD